MRTEPKLLHGQNEATKLLSSLGIDDPRDVELEDIAAHLNVSVVEGGLKGAEARLVRLGKKGRIRVRAGIPEYGRRRFALAHELGHWLLHEASSQIGHCMTSDIHGYAGSNEELESNAFAGELLMPKALIRERYGKAERSLELISSVANDLLTTFTATAVRLVETTRDPCMVVFSKNGKVQWSRCSLGLTGVWLERRHPIDQDSTAWAAAQGAPPTSRFQRARSDTWFAHLDQCSRLEVHEQSMLLKSYETVVTILACLEHDQDW